MIVQLLLTILLGLFDIVFSWLPSVQTLPFGIDDPLSLVFGWVAYIQTVLWPLNVIIDVLLLYISWRVLIMVYKKVFGSRAVIH